MIYVTEEQAKVIKKAKNNFVYIHNVLGFMHENTDLDLVTIARIIEGEEYEIGRTFKVGDIVLRNGMLYEVLEINVHLVDDRCTLVCKAENREDLAHE